MTLQQRKKYYQEGITEIVEALKKYGRSRFEEKLSRYRIYEIIYKW